MKNRLYYNPKVNPNIFNEIRKEMGFVGYYDLPLQDISYLSRLEKFKNKKHIVIVGIGGSSLGTKAVHTFISHREKSDKKLHFIETTDPIMIKQVLNKIEMESILFLIISKSGGTIETISTFKYILSFKKLNKKDFIFITDLDSNLHKLGEKYNIETFDIGKNVGGRFSVLSSVGIIPLYLMGYNVKKLLKGAKKVRDEFFYKDGDIKNNLLKKASFYAEHMLHYNINALFSYSEIFRDFNAWYVQLWAESLGKKQIHSQLNVGLTPVGLIGPTDQHSFLQLIVEGPKDKTVTFIKIKSFNDDTKVPDTTIDFLENLDIVNKVKFETLINMQADSIIENLKKRQVPLDVIEIEEADISYLGQLFFYFELLTSLTGKMLAVNTYNQPGVEEGKMILKDKLENKS